jgi:hypothetical protein
MHPLLQIVKQKQIKQNFCCNILIFANNLVIATEKQNNLQKIITETELGRFLYFDCNSWQFSSNRCRNCSWISKCFDMKTWHNFPGETNNSWFWQYDLNLLSLVWRCPLYCTECLLVETAQWRSQGGSAPPPPQWAKGHCPCEKLRSGQKWGEGYDEWIMIPISSVYQ